MLKFSTSSTFYQQFFSYKSVYVVAFLWLQFGFVIFWEKEIGSKLHLK